MFDPNWLEKLEPVARQNLVQAFITIGKSGIVEAHVQTVMAQATDGYWDQSEEDLAKKIRETRLKLSMMRSLAGFCQHIEEKLGVEQ
jgi:hypothetical protein